MKESQYGVRAGMIMSRCHLGRLDNHWILLLLRKAGLSENGKATAPSYTQTPQLSHNVSMSRGGNFRDVQVDYERLDKMPELPLGQLPIFVLIKLPYLVFTCFFP